MEKYMLGIDIGTTNVKVALYTYLGKEILVESTSYDLNTDEEGAATQDPWEIKKALFSVIKKVTATCKTKGLTISLISFSSAMHSLIAMDKEHQPITPVLTWGDRRAEKYVKTLESDKKSSLYHRTGTPIHPMSPFVKLLWLQEEHSQLMKKAERLIGIKTFILFQFFEEYYTDYSIASATGLFNLHTLSWDEEALNATGVKENQLATLCPTTERLTGLKSAVAKELGLTEDVEIVIGASDGVLSNLGVNAISSKSVALTIGTSGAIRSVTKQPLTDDEERTFCYALTENHWVIGGAINNGGVVLDWAADRLIDSTHTIDEFTTADDRYTDLMTRVEGIQPGSEGLFFHPYLVGERAPIWRADVKGSFFGLDIHHHNAHMLRAVLEGINYNLYAVYRAISEVIDNRAEQIFVTGGFAKSSTWVQMLADIFGINIVVTDITENACFGAGVLGLLAIGEINNFSRVGDMVSILKTYHPNQKRHAFYQKDFETYLELSHHFLKMYDML